MDEMHIDSTFMRTIVSKLIKKLIKSKTGYDVDILLNKIHVTIDDGNARVHLDVDAEMSKSELMKVFKFIGLD